MTTGSAVGGGLFREIFDHAVNGLLVLRPGPTGPVVLVANHAAAALLGVQPEELAERPWTGLAEADIARLDGAIGDLLSGRRTRWQDEVHLADGGRAWVVLSLSRLDSGGEPTVLAELEDRTAGRRAEARLRAAQVREREAVERLHALDRAKTDFISSVSHELRTPPHQRARLHRDPADGRRRRAGPSAVADPRARRAERSAAAHPGRGPADALHRGVR